MINRRGMFGRFLGGIAAMFAVPTIGLSKTGETTRDVKIRIGIDQSSINESGVTEEEKFANNPPNLRDYSIFDRTIDIVEDDEEKMTIRIITKYRRNGDPNGKTVKYLCNVYLRKDIRGTGPGTLEEGPAWLKRNVT